MHSQSRSSIAFFAFVVIIVILAFLAGTAKAQSLTNDPTRIGAVAAGRTVGVQSYLRIFNSSPRAEAATVNILAADGVRVLATWRGTIAAHASPQIAMADIEAAASPHLQPSEIAAQYSVSVATDGPGFVQHVVWSSRDGTLATANACGVRVASATRFAINVHSNLIGGYPSTLTVLNSSARDQNAVFDVYDAATGNRVAGYSTTVRAGNSTTFTQAQFAAQAGFAARSEYQLNFALAADFPGSLSHSVTSLATGQAQSLSEMCVLPATSRDGLAAPALPVLAYAYADSEVSLPPYYLQANAPGSAAGTDNTPAYNPITNAGAALGRVLFYDKRLSVNNTVACASCHQQARGFTDARRLSTGFAGGLTARHSMSLSNARFYERGRFFWDERATTLEDQVLQPIQNATEMGMTLDALTAKLTTTDFYPALFRAAFSSESVTSDRISRALAQFVRSMSSYRSKYDQALAVGPNGVARVLTAQEQEGLALFGGGPNPNGPPGNGNGPGRGAGCVRCHETTAHALDQPHNTGLDATITDVGAGNGRFKAPSLRNAALRGTYMHDGRFASLAEVVEFYNAGIRDNPNLDRILRGPGGAPQRLNLTLAEKAALVAFLETLTDQALIADVRLSDPFSQ